MTEFGIEFVPRDLYWKTTYYAIQAEKTGFTHLWITDHFNNRNVYVALSIVSAYTDKIKFGPGVTNPYFFHPVVTAQAIASLNEIAPGRVICGLGAGDKTTMKMVNIKQTNPLSTIREAVQIIREVSSGKDIEFEGENFNISGAKLNFRIASPVPIFIGAQGPKMLMLAGEIGDGVLINAASPKDVKNALTFIRQGAENAEKQMKGDLDIGAYTSFSVAQNMEKAKKAVAPVVAYIVAGCPEIILERHGISTENSNKIREAIVHGKWKEVFSYVTPEMVEAFSICGTPEVCIEKIDKLLKLGITQLVVGSPIGPHIRKSINTIAAEIFPHFKTD